MVLLQSKTRHDGEEDSARYDEEEDSARHDGWMREFFSHHEERKRRGDLCGLPRV